MSHGTPSTQWLTDDHSTASMIQNQRLLKLRMSISSKTLWYQSTGVCSLAWVGTS